MLSLDEIQNFKTNGYVKLSGALIKERALRVQSFLWEKLKDFGIDKNLKSTWKEEIMQIQEDYKEEIFYKLITEKLYQAINQLVGENLCTEELYNCTWGWWPINFSYGISQKWTIPTEGWHWDGLNQQHNLTTNFGLLLIGIFSDIRSRGGATLLASGSHKLVLNFLKNYPNGMSHKIALNMCTKQYKWLRLLTGISDNLLERKPTPTNQQQCNERINFFINNTYKENNFTLKVEEALGDVGDVYICHPYLMHAASFNHSNLPRFICNKPIFLKHGLTSTLDANYNSILQELIHEAIT